MCVDLNKALGIRDEKGNKCYPFGNYHWERPNGKLIGARIRFPVTSK